MTDDDDAAALEMAVMRRLSARDGGMMTGVGKMVRDACEMRDAYVSRMEADLARLRDAQAWQPIATAPTNGSRVLIAAPDGVGEAWYDGGWTWGDPYHNPIPTHWMPLPEPPKLAR